MYSSYSGLNQLNDDVLICLNIILISHPISAIKYLTIL
uniref:Uncharacterized protein n=1 Tax=uncultured Desulfobacterium sp. TaxID=201089 RepID=E1YG54_9BACT|nr:unknown protein [uncultured Desulfobacterium sp.]